jgi:hypothetical protein
LEEEDLTSLKKEIRKMTTLVICDCGRVQEYDESLSLKCQHCDEEVILPHAVEMEEDDYAI